MIPTREGSESTPRAQLDVVVVAPRVDDIAAVIDALAASGRRVEQVERPESVARAVVRGRPDAALIDLRSDTMMAGRVVEWLNQQGSCRAVVITAPDDVDARLDALARDVADHVVAPFDVREVVARLERVIGSSRSARGRLIEAGDVVIDTEQRRVARGNEHVRLTPRELDVLLALVDAHGKPVTKPSLLQQVWQNEPRTENVVEAIVSSLRRKLHTLGPPVVHTVHRAGYVFRPDVVPNRLSREALVERRRQLVSERDAVVARRNKILSDTRFAGRTEPKS